MRNIFFVLILVLLAGFGLQSCKTPEIISEPDPVAVQDAQPDAVPEPEAPVEDEEYMRSVGDLVQISYDDFQRDKTDILAVIDDLATSMKNRDYDLWRTHIAPASIKYWSNKMNLQIIAAKHPKKNLSMRTLGDFFVHVFIPSRMDRNVTEIRYISSTEVKAVEVSDNKDIIYYEFEKIDGRWLVSLPTLQ